MARLISLSTQELYHLRGKLVSSGNAPEAKAAYYRAVAVQARREADRLECEADELLAQAARGALSS